MKNRGWTNMDAQDRFDEADKRMRRLIDRKAYLQSRKAPQDWLNQYDEMLVYAVRERGHFESEANDMADAQRRREYERRDMA